MRETRLPFLLPLMCAVAASCGPDIKGEGLEDSGEADPGDTDAGTSDDTNGGDTGTPAEPTRGDVEVEYTVSWELGDSTLELCTGTLAFEDVDTSFRSWTLWTDAGLELDLDTLPASAPTNAPVGEGTTVSPGAYRFVLDAESDADIDAYDALIAEGSAPACLIASGTDLTLRGAALPSPHPERTGPITGVSLRLTVIWTDRG